MRCGIRSLSPPRQKVSRRLPGCVRGCIRSPAGNACAGAGRSRPRPAIGRLRRRIARPARARGRLEKALGALLAARTGGEAASRRRGPLRPAALSGLLPLAPLPPELKERVLLACSDTAPAVLAYRRGVVLTWLTRFSRAIKPH